MMLAQLYDYTKSYSIYILNGKLYDIWIISQEKFF